MKYIKILLINIIIISITSCTKDIFIKQKITSINTQLQIPFTTKQAGVTNIVKLNTKTKTKQILSATPFKLERPIFSSDKKKVVFQTRRGATESNIWDVYIMNLDGTNLINITKKLNQPKTIVYLWGKSNRTSNLN